MPETPGSFHKNQEQPLVAQGSAACLYFQHGNVLALKVLLDAYFCKGFSSFYFSSPGDLVQLMCTDLPESTRTTRIQTKQRPQVQGKLSYSLNPRWIPSTFSCSSSLTQPFSPERNDATNIFLKTPAKVRAKSWVKVMVTLTENKCETLQVLHGVLPWHGLPQLQKMSPLATRWCDWKLISRKKNKRKKQRKKTYLLSS